MADPTDPAELVRQIYAEAERRVAEARANAEAQIEKLKGVWHQTPTPFQRPDESE